MRTKEQIRAYQKLYREKNREKIRARMAEYGKEYFQKNKERLRPLRKAWDAKNQDKRKAYTQKYLLRNPDAQNASSRKYRDSKPERVKSILKKYRLSERGVYKRYEFSAKKRSLEFDLTEEYFYSLLAGSCAYCGVSGVCGIDRIDNALGYVIENVCTCCARCNMMKKTLTKQDFLEHAAKIADYQRTKN